MADDSSTELQQLIDRFPEGGTPERIGRYRVERLLGAGSFGRVFLAHDDELKRPVAIKVPHAELITIPGQANAYRQEAQLVANLDHPHIVPIYDVGSTDQHPCFLVSKYIPGTNLAAALQQSTMSFQRIAELIATVADALHYAHTHGLIHRDVKPVNILLSQDGEPFLVDFGLAFREQEPADPRRFAGTPAYMSPEQARGESHLVDCRSDLFSLGIVLYELLTRCRPFRGQTRNELLVQIIAVEPVAPHEMNPLIPRELERICLKALAKQPGDRYSTAKEMADDLRQCLVESDNQTASSTDSPTRVDKVDSTRGQPATARRQILRMGGLLVILAAIAFGLHLQNVSLTRDKVKSTVNAVLSSSSDSTANMMKELQPLPKDLVEQELQSRAGTDDGNSKLRLALARSELGDVDLPFLVSQIESAHPDEADNLIVALGHSKQKALEAIRAEAAKREKAGNWLKGRLALVALYLGDARLASDMCRIDHRVDPVQRSSFIENLCLWTGDIVKLAELVRQSEDVGLRSAVCLGLSTVPPDRIKQSAKTVWQPLFTQWFQSAPDAVTHSAAGLPLLYWGLDVAATDSMKQQDPSRDWYVNTVGMTLISMPPTHQIATENPSDKLFPLRLMSDREVSMFQFGLFLTDAGYPIDDKPKSIPPFQTLVPALPVHLVTWSDAAMFCNWLSHKEGFHPCYHRIGRDEQGYDAGWRLDEQSDGYRLPLAAEWEHACRAGTKSPYSFGNILFKHRYLNPSGSSLEPCAIRFPNGWGLFDMHGNVAEWCADQWLDNQSPMRTICGGDLTVRPEKAQSASRWSQPPAARHDRVGFRVVRGSSEVAK